MTCETDLCVPCGLYEPRRNVYFDGKLLLARDFEDEQVYHVAKRQLLNATLHGTGTVCGLKVTEHPAEDCRARFVVLQPGLALDCCGQEIIVAQKVPVPVGDLLDADEDLVASLDGTRDLVISLVRCDRPGELAPVILADCEGAAAGGKPGRTLEGYDFALSAAIPGTLAPSVETHVPKLDWRQTLTFSEATPGAVAIDEDSGYAYVVVVPEGDDASAAASRIFVYERRNHDIVTALDGPAGPIDMAVSPVGDQLYVSFAADGAGGVAVYRKSAIRTAANPFATIALPVTAPVTDPPPPGIDPAPYARLAVSPRTGALFALDLKAGIITAWSQEAIDAWAAEAVPDPSGPAGPATLHLADWTARSPADDSGAIFSVSPNGAQLMVVDGIGTRAVRLVDVALLFGQGEAAAAPPLVTLAGERPVAATWSLDSSFVFVLSTGGTAVAPQAVVRRYERLQTDGSLRQRGQGLTVAMSRALDLAVAPGERWAYALVARVGNDDGGATVEATVAALDMDLAQAAGGLPSPDGVRFETALPGIGQSQRLIQSGKLLYVSLADESPTDEPDRGLVAVIEPDEADCGARFAAAIDGCPICAGTTHDVILATFAGYDAAKRPRMRETNPGAGEIAIDNLSYRPLVPSAQNLRAVVECILAEGIAEGPPGPRGDPGGKGDAGARGFGIEQVMVTALAAGQPPTATLTPISGDPEGDLALALGIPNGAAGTPGGQGVRGPGIQTVVVKTLASGSAATATLTAIAGDAEGDQQLNLGIPRGADATMPVTPDFARISAISWPHNMSLSFADWTKLIADPGIAIGFDKPVLAESLIIPTGDGIGECFAFDVLARNGDGSCLCPLAGTVELLADFKQTAGRITQVTPAVGGAAQIRGMRMTFGSKTPFSFGPVRILLRCDFVIDFALKRAVDGNFLRGALPTGDGVEGGLFESWFFAVGG